MNKFITILATLLLVALITVGALPVAAGGGGGQSGTTLSAYKTATGHIERTFKWTIVKTVSPDTWYLDTTSGPLTGTSTYTIMLTKDSGTDQYFVEGEIRVTNGGAVATENLTITDSLLYKPPSGPFQVFTGVTVDVSAKPILGPGESYCYPYKVIFTPVPGAKGYKNTAFVTITNHSGSLGIPKGPSPSADVTMPSDPDILVNDVVNVSDTNGGSFIFSSSGGGSYGKTFGTGDMGIHNNVATIIETGQSDDATVWVYVNGGLPVTLATFTANVSDGKVTLRWSTQSEVDNLGFHVYRSAKKNGTYDRITTDLISGAGNSTSMHIYSFTDLNVVEGVRYWYKLEDIAFDGSTKMHGPISTRSEEENLSRSIPGSFALLQNRPNPFNPSTTIAYDLPEATKVTLTVYSLSGQKVATLVSGYQEAGRYEVMWNGQDGKGQAVSSGVYLYRLDTGKQGFVESKRMLLVR